MENESEVLGYKVSHCFISLIMHIVYNKRAKSDLLKCDYSLPGKR